MIKKIRKFANSARGLVWIVSTVAPTTLTLVAAMLEKLPWSQRIPLVTGALAAGAGLAFFALRGYEQVAGWYGSRKEGARLAGELESLIGVGHTHLRIGDVAGMWAGEDSSDFRKNVCLRSTGASRSAWLDRLH